MTTTDAELIELDDGKANFDSVYDAEDPRGYFRELGGLDYVIPHHGQQIFPLVLEAQSRQRGVTEPKVLDICCSYGVNAALLTCDVTLAEIEERYRSPEFARLDPADIAELDRDFYAERRIANAPSISGLDISQAAVDYAASVGLLEEGIAENLEDGPPSSDLAQVVSDTDMITVTGGVGYVTAKTFAELYDAAEGEQPWLATFLLRRFAYNDIADVLAEHGLITERLTGVTFPQREFASVEEQEFTLSHLEDAGIDATGREAEGKFHTDFYLSRPAAEVAERPLHEIISRAPGGVRQG